MINNRKFLLNSFSKPMLFYYLIPKCEWNLLYLKTSYNNSWDIKGKLIFLAVITNSHVLLSWFHKCSSNPLKMVKIFKISISLLAQFLKKYKNQKKLFKLFKIIPSWGKYTNQNSQKKKVLKINSHFYVPSSYYLRFYGNFKGVFVAVVKLDK